MDVQTIQDIANELVEKMRQYDLEHGTCYTLKFDFVIADIIGDLLNEIIPE